MKRKVNLLVVFLLIANLMLCVTMLPKAQAGDKLPPDLIKYVNEHYKEFKSQPWNQWDVCNKCKDLEIKCGKSILGKADQYNGVTDKYEILWTHVFFNDMDRKYQSIISISVLEKKNGKWSATSTELRKDDGNYSCEYL